MKLKIFTNISYKNKTFIVSLFLICGVLLNSYAALNYTEIKKKPTTTIAASIAAADEELCLGEQTPITFEGAGGNPNYSFTYTVNNGTEQTIATENDQVSVSINTSITSSGTYVYNLIKVEDSSGDIENLDQEIIITVTDPAVVDFNFTNDNACSGETMQFTSNSTGNGTLSYSWNFGDGSTSTEENPIKVYNAVGNGSQVFSVSLIVSDTNGCTTTTIKDIQVQRIPDIDFFSGSGGFINCSDGNSDIFNLELFNNSSSSSDISLYSIEWGDGTAVEAFNGFPTNSSGIMHSYSIGVFTLTIIATNDNGCTNSISYDISNGSNPGGAFESPGSTSGLCVPTDLLTFRVLDWGTNPINTTYSVDFGDGNVQDFTQQLLKDSAFYNQSNPDASQGYEVYHSYTRGSCNEPNGEFIATLTITNDCGDTAFTIDSITALEPSEASFNVPNINCINTLIEFENETLIGDGVNCNKTARFTWDFGDGTFINTPFGSTPDNQTHTYTDAGNYTVILSVIGDCGTDTYQRNICIEPKMIASYDLNTQEGCIPLAVSTQNTIDESELCSGPTYNWNVSYSNANCGTFEDWEFTNGTEASSENPQFLFNNPGEYTLTQSITSDCGTFSTQKIINVKKPPTAAINPIANFCQPGIITPVAVIENCTENLGGITYSWTFSGGTPATSTLQNPENISYDTAGTYTVTLEVTNECGISNTATQQFEVLEKPIITNSPITQEICSNQSTAPISLTASNTNSSFLWTATTVPNNPNITGFTSNGTSQVIPSQTIFNNGTTPGNVVFTVTPNLNGCLGDTVEVLTVIVNPTPSITTQPVGSDICLDGAANVLEVVTQNGVGTPTYQWYSNTTNSITGATEVTGATNSTYTPPTDTVGEVFYFVIISFDGGCSDIQSDIVLVNTVAEPTATAVNPEQTICVDGEADTFTINLVGGLGNPTYQWFSNTTNTNSSGTPIAGATNSTYDTGVLSTIGAFYYYIEVTLDGVGCDLATSDVFTVNVVADPVIDTQPIDSQEICQNTTLEALEVVVSGNTNTGDFSYQWFSNTTNTNSGGTAIASATSKVYNPDNTTVGTFFYYVVIKQTASGCEVTSEVSTIIINEGPSITTQPIPSDICLDGAANVLEVVTQNGVGTPTYQWYASTTNTYDLTNPIAGATNSTYTPPTNTVGEVFYFVVISFDGGCSDIQSDIVLVNTVAEPTATAVNPEQTICVDGEADTFTINLVGGLGNPTYQWFSNTTNTNSGGTAIAGATNSTYDTEVLSTIGAFYYYIEVTLDGVGCDLAISDVFTVNVVADPVIDTQPIDSQEICQNTILEALEVNASGNANTGDFSYQWFSNTTNSNTGGTAITGANTNVYNPDNTTVGTFYYYVVINQTASGCEVNSEVSTIIINEGPSITTQPIPSDICLDGVANVLEVVTQNGVGTPTYQWYSNTTNSITGASEVTGATNSTYTPPTDTVGEVFYFVIIAFDGGCSDIQSDIVLVNTVAEPTATAVNPEQTICVDGEADTFTINLVGGLGNPTYQWFSNTTNTNSSGTPIAGATNSTYDTGVLSTIGAFYYYIEVTLDGVGCDLATSDVFTVNVVADPVIDTQPIDSQEICQNTTLEALEVVVSGNTNTGDFSYQWFSNTTNTNSGGTAIASATSKVYNPDNTTVGTFFYYVVIKQTASGCEVTSEVSTIIINEGPSITTQPIPSDICLDGAANVLEVVTQNGVGTPTYQWYASTTNTYDLTNPIAGATNSTYTPPTNTVGEVFYFVVISFDGGCSDIQSDIVLVNTVAEPTATAVNPEQTICVDGEADTFTINLVGGLGNPTYQWFSNTTNTNSGGTAIAGATNSTYDTEVLSTIGAFYYYIEVTLDGVGCDLAISDVFTVNVVADPVIDTQPIDSQEICQNTILEALEVNASGNANTGDFSYQWFSNTTNSNTGGTAITGANTNVYNPDNTTVGTFYYYVVINQTASGCEVNSEVSTIIINEGPSITTQPIPSDICLDGVANVLEVVTQNGVGTPTYQWYSNTTNSITGASEVTGATNSTYTPPTDTVGEVFYFVIIAFDGGCSDIQSDIVLVNTVAEPTATAVNPEQTICVDGEADTFTINLVGGLGNPTYQWFSNTTNTNSGGTAIAGATNSTYDTGVLSTIGAFYYYIEVTLDGTGCDLATSDVFTVNVVADPIIDTQAMASQEICQNTTLEALEVVVSGNTNTGDFSYQWFSNTTNSNTGGTAITGANTNVYNPDNTTVGTFYYYVVINQTASGCEVNSEVSTIIINEGPSITTQPIPSDICLDGVANVLEVVTQNGVGTPTYQWYSNTTNSITGASEVTGATNSTYTPPTDTVGEVFYFVIISFDGGCSDIQSDIVLVNTVAEPTATAVNPEQTICVDGEADTFTINLVGGLGNPTYQWFSNTTNTNSGGTAIAGATNSTYDTEVLSTIGAFYYYIEVTLDGVGCDLAISDVFTVNVVADPIIDTQAMASQEICQNTTLEALEVVVSGNTNTGDFSYQWFSNTTNTNSGGTAIASATSKVYNPDNTTVGTFFYYVVIKQTASGCEVTSEVSTIIINEGPSITTQPIPSDICLDGAANVLEVVTQNGVGTPTYQWYASTTNTYDLTNPIAGATNSTYTPPTNTVREVFYFVVISFDGGCSDIQSDIVLVNTVAEPTATAVNPEQTICVDGEADTFTINLVGGLGNPTYQWFSNTTNTNSGGTAIAGATNSTYDTGVLSTIGAFYYYIEVTLDGVGCDLAISDVFTVNVVADPIIDTQAMASQEICQNTTLEALEVVVSGNTNTGDFSYQWFSNTTNTNSGGTAIASATSKVYNPDNSTVGTFFYYVVINQTASGCEVTSEVSTIIINEGPSITTQPIPSDICLDGAANVLEVVTQNGVGTPTYQWYSNTTNSITGATEVTGATNSTYTPPTNTVGEVFYFVIIAFDGGCSDIQSDIVLVKVNQIPVIDFAEITIYSEETFLFDPSSIASNIIPAGTTYTWTTPTSSTPGAILGSSAESSPQTNISQTLENTDIFPVIETYIITPATPNCAGNPFTLEVTVNPKIIPNVLVTNNTCFESNDGIITTNITGGVPFTTGTSYLISWTGPNSFTSTASSISNLIAGIYILRIEDSNGVFITEQYTVTQPDLLTITTDLEQNISCFEGSDGAIEVSASGGTLSYTFNWTTTDGTGIIQGNEDQSGLTAGTYNLELTDDNKCVATQTFILTEPQAIAISTVLKEDILCFGDATGAIEINITGGTPIEVSTGVFDYSYSWTGPNGFTSNAQNISNLFAGTYTIEITDDLGCIERTDIVLTQPTVIEINYTKTDATCYGATDGSIDVTVNGGRPPYQISWSNLGNGFSQSNLSAGNYIATIVDENQCEANVTITIDQPIFFIAPIVSPISCNNENDASIDLNLTGGVAPITVLWSDDPSAGIQRNNLGPGTYEVTIIDSDSNQCPIEETFIITNPPLIAVTNIVTDAIDCTIENSGSILLDVSGGTPPYDFIWNTGQTTEDLTNIPAGDYSVEIKDKNNCVINKQFSIYRQEPIEIEFLVTEIPDCDLKTVSQRTVAKVTGGFLPYTYSWSAGSVSITDNTIMTTSQNGSYTLTITDDKGCTESKIFLVDLPSIGNADYSYDAFSIDNYNLLSIEDPIQFTNLIIGNYSNITWDFGDGSPTTSDENPVHIYDQVGVFKVVLKIELDFGCIEIIEKTLNITQGYVLINPNAFSPNNDGYNETIRPSFKGFKEIEMTIYDTWGVPIYYENNLELNGWDGTIKGLPAENGNYVMVVKGNTFYEKEIITITALTLLK